MMTSKLSGILLVTVCALLLSPARTAAQNGPDNDARPAWSPAHEEARAWLLGRLRAAGLAARVDSAGNVFGRLGEGAPVVMTGSHIDTVPRGGPLDGALGVLAGLECLRAVAASGRRPARPLEVAAFTDEEGRVYGFFGSRAMTGALDRQLAERLADPAGLPLPEAMRRAGFDLAAAPTARRDAGDIAAYVELHIEQGPWLEADDLPIGVVESIVGIRRFRLVFVGQPDHAGTTPMDRRKDAFLTAAEYAAKSRDLVVRGGQGRAVTTIGVVDVRPGVPNIVPERAAGIFFVRAATEKRLERLKQRVEACFQAGASASGAEVFVRKVGEDYVDLLTNSPLASAYGANLARLGRTVRADVPSVVTGSTDMGNVSKLVPTVHPMIAVSPPNVALHSHEFTKWVGSEAGHRAIVDGAKVLAMTALDVLRDDGLRAAMKASFDADLAAAR